MRWILISDASRARLFAERSGTWELLEKFEHPESRERARDLMADTNGRKPAGPSMGGAYGGRAVSHSFGRAGVEPDTDPKEVEAQKFARELAGRLERGHFDHAYDNLVIAAPPHFLGLMKGVLSREVEKRVEAFLNKDLTHHDTRQLQEHVEKELAS